MNAEIRRFIRLSRKELRSDKWKRSYLSGGRVVLTQNAYVEGLGNVQRILILPREFVRRVF